MSNWLMNEKIKYILGIEKNLPGYPTKEDFFHIIRYWWFEDMGKEIMTKYKWFQKLNLNSDKTIYFPEKIFDNYFDIEFEEKIQEFIQFSINLGYLKMIKETQKDRFYEWCRHIEQND